MYGGELKYSCGGRLNDWKLGKGCGEKVGSKNETAVAISIVILNNLRIKLAQQNVYVSTPQKAVLAAQLTYNNECGSCTHRLLGAILQLILSFLSFLS
jgi:hypothetical protein